MLEFWYLLKVFFLLRECPIRSSKILIFLKHFHSDFPCQTTGLQVIMFFAKSSWLHAPRQVKPVLTAWRVQLSFSHSLCIVFKGGKSHL